MYDFGLSPEQFGEMTPAMFQALLDRRNEKFKYDCFMQGMPTAAIYNVNRDPEKTKALSPYDFVPGKQAVSREDELRQNIASLFSMMGHLPSHELLNLRERTVDRLKAQGFEAVETIFDELFVAWKIENQKED